ncbi:hypothetical protein R3J22_07705 [Trueperella bernardiae]|uniref:hypothetical protein n=1 Tax=Trueperella bernardiae TaxID=59561 RepID=UPI0029490F6F|nr:hypothetical protein [Trueperella bernardiae]MDV6239410.1 hypothetical protein [Trueperella bernardiae]
MIRSIHFLLVVAVRGVVPARERVLVPGLELGCCLLGRVRSLAEWYRPCSHHYGFFQSMP